MFHFLVLIFSVVSFAYADNLHLTLIKNTDNKDAVAFAKPDWNISSKFQDAITIGDQPNSTSNIYQTLSTTQSILATHDWEIEDINQPIMFKTYQDHSVIYGTIKLTKGRFYQSSVNLVEIDHDQYYSLKQTRRISSDQINYFDHPRFGLFLQIHTTNKANTDAKLS